MDAIYAAAHLGLKGDNLALAAGLLPSELNHLIELDPRAELAARKGRADAEFAHAKMLHQASLNGDAKASLAILQHVHGWSAKQSLELSGDAASSLQVVFVNNAELQDAPPVARLSERV